MKKIMPRLERKKKPRPEPVEPESIISRIWNDTSFWDMLSIVYVILFIFTRDMFYVMMFGMVAYFRWIEKEDRENE